MSTTQQSKMEAVPPDTPKTDRPQRSNASVDADAVLDLLSDEYARAVLDALCERPSSARGLVESIGDEEMAHDRAIELAADPEAGERWECRRDALLDDSVDVTDYMLDLIAEAADE